MDSGLYRVSSALPEDIGAVMELERSGFGEGIVEEEGIFLARMACFPAGFVLLRESLTGRPAGYLCAERWTESPGLDAGGYALGHDPLPRHDSAGTVLYIASMTVDPALRGAGLGALLFREGRRLIHRLAMGISRELLLVNEVWSGARHIYEDEGFLTIGRLPGFFPAEVPGGELTPRGRGGDRAEGDCRGECRREEATPARRDALVMERTEPTCPPRQTRSTLSR